MVSKPMNNETIEFAQAIELTGFYSKYVHYPNANTPKLRH